MKSEVCIVGGGPAGLAAAIALAQSGREVTVLDCGTPPIDKACGEGLFPNSLAALAKLGVTLAGSGVDLHGIRFDAFGRTAAAHFSNGIGRGVRRVALHQSLIARAERLGIRLLWGVTNVQTTRGRVSFKNGHVETNLIVGADGLQSTVRRDARLDEIKVETRRFGFRRHYRLAPWSPYVEVYWGDGFQLYVTPVAADEVGVALLSGDPHLRLAAALRRLPALSARLAGAAEITAEKGSLSVTRKLQNVYADGYVLLGDASGSVDAITGEGLCLAFRQAGALVDALDARDMQLYQRSHRQIMRKPLQMAGLLLLLGRHQALRRRTMEALSACPQIFKTLLAWHVNQKESCVV